MALHELEVSVVVKRLGIFASLALGTLAPMFYFVLEKLKIFLMVSFVKTVFIVDQCLDWVHPMQISLFLLRSSL